MESNVSSSPKRKFWTWKRMVLRFFYPLYVVVASKKKVDQINRASIEKVKKDGGELTILLHGIMTNYYSSTYWAIKWFLRNGLNVVSLGYDYKADVAVSAVKIKRQMDAILQETGSKKVNMVAISLGGSIARYYIEKFDGKDAINKLVTIFASITTANVDHPPLALRLMRLVSRKQAEISLARGWEIDHLFSVKDHLAIYGTSDWIVGSDGYPLKYAPSYIKQVSVPGGHMLVSYNVDAMEEALRYLKSHDPVSVQETSE